MPSSLFSTSNHGSVCLGNIELTIMESSSGGLSGSGFDQSIPDGQPNCVDNGESLALTTINVASTSDSRAAAEQIALQLAILRQQNDSSRGNGGHCVNHGNNMTDGLHRIDRNQSGILNQINSASASDLLNCQGATKSLEDLKSRQKRSQNMTECVPVPSSEHVAEIVGRQGKNTCLF